MRYDEKLRAHGPLQWILVGSGVMVFLVSVPQTVQEVLDSSNGTWERVGTAVGGLFGLALALWIATMYVRVRISSTTLTASLPPLYRRRIPLEDIHSAQRVEVHPLREYYGWGVKGTRDNRLLGMSGNEGVRIDYGQGKRLVILIDDPDRLVEAIRRTRAPQHAHR